MTSACASGLHHLSWRSDLSPEPGHSSAKVREIMVKGSTSLASDAPEDARRVRRGAPSFPRNPLSSIRQFCSHLFPAPALSPYRGTPLQGAFFPRAFPRAPCLAEDFPEQIPGKLRLNLQRHQEARQAVGVERMLHCHAHELKRGIPSNQGLLLFRTPPQVEK